MRLDTKLDVSALPEVDRFLRKNVSHAEMDELSSNRIRLVSEEILLNLVRQGASKETDNPDELVILVRHQNKKAKLEFIASSG